jgi:hypothetical protein
METFPEQRKTPGIVLFVAVLNFLSATLFFFLTLFCLLLAVFGTTLGIAESAAQRLADYQAQFNMAYGAFFLVLTAMFLAFFAFFLAVGIGQLKGKRFSWFVQIGLSVLGLLGFPIWTVLNGVILYFFFQPRTRDYFGV